MDTASAIREAVEAARTKDLELPPPSVRRAYRVKAGLTQDQLGGPVGVSRVAISRYESGAREPRGETRRRYADALEAMRDA